jgi:hypothetical protein
MKQDNFPWRHWLVYVYCLAGDIICWASVLVLWVFFGDKLVWQNGLWVGISKGSFWCRVVAKGIVGGTMGHGGWYVLDLMGDDGIDTKLEFHEHVHVEQYEVTQLVNVIIQAGHVIMHIVNGQLESTWLMTLLYWMFGGLVGTAAGWIVAILRGERAYRGSQHEEAAYSLEKGFRKGKK